MTRLLRLLPPGRFARAVLLVAGGAAVAQALTVLASPLLTRLYSPEGFGLYQMFVSAFTLLLTVASFRYEVAVPLPRSERKAVHLLSLALLCVAGTSLLVGAAVPLAGPPVARWLDRPAAAAYLWLLPIALIPAGCYRVLSFWAMRRQEYGVLAATRFRQGVGKVVTQLGLGLLGAGPVGLMAGEVAGRAVGAGHLARNAWRQARPRLRFVRTRGLRAMARRYRRFPTFVTGSSLLRVAGAQLPPLLLVGPYGARVAGLYALAFNVIGLPMGLLGQAVAQVFEGEGSSAARDRPQELRPLVRRTLAGLFAAGLVPAGVLALFGPPLFALVFGEQWREAGHYARLLSPMLLAQFVAVPVTHLFNIAERQDLQLGIDATNLALILGAVLVLPLLGHPPGTAILAYSLALTATHAVTLSLLVRL